ncbi:MAG: peptidoglycan-binding domain-containing protein, partial [Candidatus Pacebacteria bacterium]|nr:peptidoglycan-binding domain-containing protein [Candidatus Paceibacterota bacterium]
MTNLFNKKMSSFLVAALVVAGGLFVATESPLAFSGGPPPPPVLDLVTFVAPTDQVLKLPTANKEAVITALGSLLPTVAVTTDIAGIEKLSLVWSYDASDNNNKAYDPAPGATNVFAWTAVMGVVTNPNSIPTAGTIIVTNLVDSSAIARTSSGIFYSDAGPIVKKTTDNNFINIATSLGGGIINYTSSNPAVATVNSITGEVKIMGAGSTVITARQAESTTHTGGVANYTLIVSLNSPTITFAEEVVKKVLSDKPFINVATGSGGGAITYTSNDVGIAKVNSSTGKVTIVGVGTTTITATQVESATHEGASEDYVLIVSPSSSTPAFTAADPVATTLPDPVLNLPSDKPSTSAITITDPVATTLPDSVLNLPHIKPSSPDEVQANRVVLLKFLVNLISNLSTPALVSSSHLETESFNNFLSQGMNNGEVKRLQQFLVSQGGDIYPRGLVTGYYGILTRQAVGRFQIAQGIVSSDSDVEYGVVGP